MVLYFSSYKWLGCTQQQIDQMLRGVFACHVRYSVVALVQSRTSGFSFSSSPSHALSRDADHDEGGAPRLLIVSCRTTPDTTLHRQASRQHSSSEQSQRRACGGAAPWNCTIPPTRCPCVVVPRMSRTTQPS